MHITEYLIKKGFKAYRKRYNRKIKEWEYTENTTDINSFSSMGDLDIRFIKGKIEVVYGLHEIGKPPTLIYPRPNIKVIKKNEKIDQTCDNAMNICLEKEKAEDIFKAMFNENICFIYNLT